VRQVGHLPKLFTYVHLFSSESLSIITDIEM